MFATTASAQWTRGVATGKGGYTDNPPVHSLNYFTVDPYKLADGGARCTACAIAGLVLVKRFVVEADVHPVGSIAGVNVVDVLYRIGLREDGKPTNVDWKSILIQTGPDQYHEIFHYEGAENGAEPKPSRIIKVGDQLVLSTNNSGGGNGGGCIEAYWLVNPSGVREIDFSALETAVRAQVPPETSATTHCYALSMVDQFVHAPVQRDNAECHACGWIGYANAHFRLEGARAIPTDVEFVPNAEYSSTVPGDGLPRQRRSR